MQSWQYWMTQGNSAYQQHQLSHAVYCYRQALSDVWPIWYHCAFVCCPAEFNIEEASLPTHCFAVVLLNLAETYAKAGEWRLCQRTLAQGSFWFRRLLQQHITAQCTAAVLQQQAALTKARAHYQRMQQQSRLAAALMTPSPVQAGARCDAAYTADGCNHKPAIDPFQHYEHMQDSFSAAVLLH